MNEEMQRVYTRINFRLLGVCALCVSRDFRRGKVWGRCKRHKYAQTRSGKEAPIRIHLVGSCDVFELDEGCRLGRYAKHLVLSSKEDKMAEAINTKLKR